jgi:hypothetical protein
VIDDPLPVVGEPGVDEHHAVALDEDGGITAGARHPEQVVGASSPSASQGSFNRTHETVYTSYRR